jgi:hypothetical protein
MRIGNLLVANGIGVYGALEHPGAFAIAKFPASSVKSPNYNKLASDSSRQAAKMQTA